MKIFAPISMDNEVSSKWSILLKKKIQLFIIYYLLLFF